MKEAFLVPVTELDKAKECEKKMDIACASTIHQARCHANDAKGRVKNISMLVIDGSTKYPIWFIAGDLAKKWGDSFKKDNVLDIRNSTCYCAAIKDAGRYF